ncbi:MAG: PspC domain-containing protein [Muribaculaceae bacterium]|nr:PspC domain-containing protein [Muribaculaceae bacterium]
MKKTININLAGYPFTIDEDAYKLLKDYLDTIRYAFETKDDTEDLAEDIESRIAEILIERENGAVRIVTFDEISKVIERIGRPSEFIEIEEIEKEDQKSGEEVEESQEQISITPPPYDPNRYSRNPFVRKRMFRDPQNSMLGGVCAGLAAYLNVDVTIVRLVAVLLLFLSATTVGIVYIILWIVLPPASTPLQRMQMRGENPTMENIGKRVTENYQESENGSRSVSNNNDKGIISTTMSIFVKCLIILGFIICCPIAIVLAATLIGCMIAVFIIGIGIFSGSMFDSVNEGLMVLYILLAVIGGVITLGVPIWLLIRKLWKNKDAHTNPATQRSLLIIWLCGLALVAVFSVKSVKESHRIEHYVKEQIIDFATKDMDIDIDDFMDLDEVKNINIKHGKITVETYDGRRVVIENGKVKTSVEEETIQESVEGKEGVGVDSLQIEQTVVTDTIVS